MSQGEEGEVGERLEVGGERGTVCWSFLHNSYSCLAKKNCIAQTETITTVHTRKFTESVAIRSRYNFSRSVGWVPLMGLKENGLAWSGTVKEEGNMMAHTRAPHTFNL